MRTRNLTLDICDYNNNVLCNLYSNTSDLSGQATEVFVKHERNGWKELTFKLPSTCMGEAGEERNYRLDYLIADYRLRLVDDEETDWFLVSEPKITHNAFSTDVEVKAGHISQLLKTKNYDLEFSDEEGNNVGTPEQLLTTILDGTGWEPGLVEEFLDYDGSVKKRSLVASAKTGAFKMITDMCELFDAKPVFHGDSKTVDILHMNPFSKTEDDQVPTEVLEGGNVLELSYDKNIFNISRTTNTENIATKLYAYGSFTTDASNMCDISTCSHKEYTIHVAENQTSNKEYKFTADDATYYFTATNAINTSTVLIWSKLDFASQSYVWNETNKKAYHVYKEPKDEETCISTTVTEEVVKNWVPALMNFNYYDSIGLLTDNMVQEIAKYQRDMPIQYERSYNAGLDMFEAISELSEIGESNSGFLKLDISNNYSVDNSDNMNLLCLTINKTTAHPDGVIYRSDYNESRKNYFQWSVASQLKPDGLPIPQNASVLFIVHATNPVTYDKLYLKSIWNDNNEVYHNETGAAGNFVYSEHEDDPAKITLFGSADRYTYKANDRYYLFCTDSMSGSLGTLTSNAETLVNNVKGSTREATRDGGSIEHRVRFVDEFSSAPEITIEAVNYGWYYQFYSSSNQVGNLYICWGEKGENSWNKVYVDETTPSTNVSNDQYFLNRKTGKFYHRENNEWVLLEEVNEKNCAKSTSIVYRMSRERDMIFNGFNEQYTYSPSSQLVAGNYAFKSPYDFYYVFTTYYNTPANTKLTLKTIDGQVWPDSDIEHISSFRTVNYDSITFMNENEIDPSKYTHGNVNNEGTYYVDENKYVSNYINVYGGATYQCRHPAGRLYYYKANKSLISYNDFSASVTTMVMPENAVYARFVCSSLPGSSNYFRVSNYNNLIYVGKKLYTILTPTPGGELFGINNLMKKMADKADNIYGTLLNTVETANDTINTKTKALNVLLGDLLREAIWQDEKYVEGDEDKLYIDAMDNLEEVGQPEYTYDFTFLDLYGANQDTEFYTEEDAPEWPDIHVTDAVHILDPEINISKWGYIDKLEKCYDQPWKTKIEVNTRLSLIGQHSFTDLLTRIAEVANETKAKQSVYKRAQYLNSAGYLATQKLEGALNAARNIILGGSSSWYTDNRGRIVFESTDGNHSMMLSGAGLLISNSKDEWGDWNWRTALTGAGLAADEVAAGFLSAKEALIGSITTDMINAAVGNELEIGSNKALQLYATANGERPAGALTTDDALIEIAAGDGTNPAHINILSGGEINLKAGVEGQTGGKLNIESYGQLNIKSGADMTVEAGGDLFINGGSINIQTNNVNGRFVVDSPKFKVKADGSVELDGKVTANSGSIAGFTIAEHVNTTTGQVDRRYIYSGTSSLSSTANGIYIGTDGVNFGGGKFIVSSNGDTVKLKISAEDIQLGTTTLKSTLDTINSNVESAQESATSVANTKTQTYRCTAAQIKTKEYKVGDIWINTESTYAWQYICKQVSSTRNSTTDWTLVSTAITEGAALSIDAVNGNINMAAANSITIGAGATISIAANKKLSLTTAGTIEIGNGVKPFIIGATTGTNGHAYMYNGPSTITGATAGIYLGTDGINIYLDDLNYYRFRPTGRFAIRAGMSSISDSQNTDGVFFGNDGLAMGGGKFKATKEGNLTATSADIKGSIKATSLYINATDSSNGTQIALDSSGFIVSSSTTVNNAKVQSMAGISVDSSGIVISSTTTDVASAVTTAAGIVVDANGRIALSSLSSSVQTNITKASNLTIEDGKVAISCLSQAAQNAISIAAGLDIDSDTGKIKLSSTKFDKLGSSSSGIYITPDTIKVSSGGTINIDGGSINLSVSWNNISDKPSLFTVPTGVTIAEKQVKVYSGSNNYVNITHQGVYAKGTEIKLDAASGSNHVYITSSGIDIKGNRVTITGDDGEVSEIWGRDDIIIMNPNETDPTKAWRKTVPLIEEHMGIGTSSAKYDWVLIQPYYNVTLSFTHGGMEYYPSSSGNYDSLAQKYILTSSDAAPYFGNGAQSYSYKISFTVAQQAGSNANTYRYLVMALVARKNSTGEELTYYCTHDVGDTKGNVPVMDGVGNTSSNPLWFYKELYGTSTSNVSLTMTSDENLCADGWSLYFYFLDKTGGSNLTLTNIRLDASCAGTKNKVPCTVYYYSK